MLGLGLADPERQRDIVDADTFNLWASASSLPSPGSMRRSTNLLTGMFGEIIMQKLDTACDKNASSFVHSVSDRIGVRKSIRSPADASKCWRGVGKKGKWCGVKPERKGETGQSRKTYLRLTSW